MRIETITHSNLHLINTIDSTFTVASKLKINLLENRFSYEIESVIPYEKFYGFEKIDFSLFVDSMERIVFFAFINKELAGQIILVKHWGHYACIDDIRIEKKYRGKGIGSKLIQKSTDWAKMNNCIGMVVETQNVNVKACLFYEKNGFVLGGVNMYAYKASEIEKEEILLNWYLLF